MRICLGAKIFAVDSKATDMEFLPWIYSFNITFNKTSFPWKTLYNVQVERISSQANDINWDFLLKLGKMTFIIQDLSRLSMTSFDPSTLCFLFPFCSLRQGYGNCITLMCFTVLFRILLQVLLHHQPRHYQTAPDKRVNVSPSGTTITIFIFADLCLLLQKIR